jgi:hypothetical protein
MDAALFWDVMFFVAAFMAALELHRYFLAGAPACNGRATACNGV